MSGFRAADNLGLEVIARRRRVVAADASKHTSRLPMRCEQTVTHIYDKNTQHSSFTCVATAQAVVERRLFYTMNIAVIVYGGASVDTIRATPRGQG